MAKKKMNQRTSDGANTSTATAFVTGDIKSIIHDHSLFFDSLVELIPAKFYLPTNEKDKVYFQGLTAQDKAKSKQKTIENTKKARRNRLDPMNSSKTTLDLLKESIENEKLDTDDDELGDDVETSTKSETVTYEELQQRLRRKLDELKAGRGGNGGSSRREEARLERKRKWEFDRKEDKREAEKEAEEKKKKEEDKRKIEMEIAEAAQGIEFGKLKLDDDFDKGDGRKRGKKRKITKEKELEIAQQLQEAKKDPEKGELVAKKHSWKAAADRAMGVKVHDNPKLLKESMQKEKKKHQKSVDKWKDRVKSTETLKKNKQEKRKGNIEAKMKEKKMKKIEKREKKLTNRPGFEGRKDGYINGD